MFYALDQIRRLILVQATSRARSRQLGQKIGFSKTMKSDDEIKRPGPYLANQTCHISECCRPGPVAHRNTVDGERLVDGRAQFRNRRAAVSSQECQPSLGKSSFE